jgi:hypothetical protein
MRTFSAQDPRAIVLPDGLHKVTVVSIGDVNTKENGLWKGTQQIAIKFRNDQGVISLFINKHGFKAMKDLVKDLDLVADNVINAENVLNGLPATATKTARTLAEKAVQSAKVDYEVAEAFTFEYVERSSSFDTLKSKAPEGYAVHKTTGTRIVDEAKTAKAVEIHDRIVGQLLSTTGTLSNGETLNPEENESDESFISRVYQSLVGKETGINVSKGQVFITTLDKVNPVAVAAVAVAAVAAAAIASTDMED